MDFGFHERVREGFLEIAQDEPARFRILDGHLELDVLLQKVIQIATREFSRIIPHPHKLTIDRNYLD